MNWDDEADLYLKDHYNDTSAKRIAKELGCDPEDVYRRAYKLGLGCRQVWTRAGGYGDSIDVFPRRESGA